MKNILILLLSLVCFFGYSQTQLDPSLTPTTARINAAIKGSLTAAGTNTYTTTLSGFTLNDGDGIDLTFTNGNTGSSTYTLNGGTTLTIKKKSSGSLVDIVSGDIINGDRMRLYRSGTFLVIESGGSSGGGGGSGTVTSVSVTTANGVSGSVTNPTTTPAISLTLGAITPTTVNGVTVSGSSSPSIAVTGTTTISGTHSGTSSGTNTGDNASNSSSQPVDSDLTTIAGLTPSNDDIMQFKSSAWTNRTLAQILADLFPSKTANTFYAAPNGSAGVPTFRAIVSADIPTLNQNTTGSAGSVANALTVDNSSLQLNSGTTYDGSAAKTISVKASGITNAMLAGSIDLATKVTGLLPVANGGTGTATPGIVAGTNVTVTGTWPNQTVNSTGAGVSIASLAETQAGTDNTKVITPLRLASVTNRVYNVLSYAALGDGKLVTDGVITSGTAILTSASGQFVSTDAGKSIRIGGAGAAASDLLTTILSYQSATQVTISVNASTTVASGGYVQWGTDNTTPIQNVINAVFSAGGGTIYFPNGYYLVFGALQTSVSGQNPNCVLYIPQQEPSNNQNTTIKFLGEEAPNKLINTNTGAAIKISGVIIESMILGSGTRPALLGSVKSSADNFNYCGFQAENIRLRVRSKTAGTPIAPTMTAFGMGHSYTFEALNCIADTETIIFDSVEPTTSTVIGFETPFINNTGAAGNYIKGCAAQGFYKGYELSDHTSVQESMTYGCEYGMAVQAALQQIYISSCSLFNNKYDLVFEGNAGIETSALSLEAGAAGRWYSTVYNFYAPSPVTSYGTIRFTKNAVRTQSGTFGNVFFHHMRGSQQILLVGGDNQAYPTNGGTGEWNGSISTSSKPYFEVKSPNSENGSGGNQPDIAMSHIQTNTSDALVGRFVVFNTQAAADDRIANINFCTNGALQKGIVHFFMGNGSGVTDVHTISTDDSRFAVKTYFGSATNVAPTAQVHIAQPALTTSGGLPAFLVAPGAHTNLTLSTELTDVNYNLARTVQFATGALTTQRAFRIQAPTYGFVGASTITTASTVSISGSPTAGTNATITNAFALDVESGTSRFQGGIKGSVTNDAATAGNIGEHVSSLIAIGSAVSLTTATAANVTSISLTAGDWDVTGTVNFSETTATVSARTAGLSSTSATLPTDGSEAYCGVQSTVTSETNSVTLTRKRFSLAGTTTIYLVGQATFSAGTCAGFGNITARRVR